MKAIYTPAQQPVDIVSDHACLSCGGDRRGRGKSQPGLCDTCEAAANAAKSRALRTAKRILSPQPLKVNHE